jgi:hypothetical protein
VLIPAAAELWVQTRKLNGAALLEIHPFGYTAAQAHEFIAAQGPTGRRWYAIYQLIDGFFILAVTGALVSFNRWGLARLVNPGILRSITLLPIGYAMADLAEDAALLLILWGFPGQMESVSRLASRLTPLKFSLLAASILGSAIIGGKAWPRRR